MTLAGFFGLFDYNKVGPGVDKNGPRKKGFVIFFEIFFRKFWKLICVNLLYVLVSIPIVTNGLAQAGMTFVTRNFAREKHAFISGDFFDTIKKNWKQALIIGLINLFLTGILFFDLYFFYMGSKGVFSYIMLAISLSIYMIFTFMKYYMSMMLITFKLSIKQIYKNSFIFAMAGLKRNLLISVVLIACYAAGIGFLFLNLYIGLTVDLLLFIFIFPAFRSFLIQYNIFPLIKKHMIDPYYKEHPGEDKQAKRSLNIEDDEPVETEEDEIEPVFHDTGRTDKDELEAETPKKTIPQQYSERDIRRGRKYVKKTATPHDDDDDTI